MQERRVQKCASRLDVGLRGEIGRDVGGVEMESASVGVEPKYENVEPQGEIREREAKLNCLLGGEYSYKYLSKVDTNRLYVILPDNYKGNDPLSW